MAMVEMLMVRVAITEAVAAIAASKSSDGDESDDSRSNGGNDCKVSSVSE